MADFALPILTSTYSDLVDLLKARDVSSMKLFDGTTDSNLPSGTKRWNSTNSYFEKFDGSAWSPLVAKYMINVDLLDGCSVNDGGSSINDLWTADKITTQLSTKLNASSYTAADILTKIKTVDGAGSGLDADLLDGMNALSTNTASSIVARDASGNFSAGTITATLNGTATTLSGDSSNWATNRSSAVANMLGWKNYGNGHVIFDASNGTAPNGAAINNTNPGTAWSGSYPTLMGWNGSTTYGVRVDSARVADSVNGGTVTATTGRFTSTVIIDDTLTVGNGKNAATIYMYDSDEGNRTIHCNSNNIGFLKQDGSWGSWCSDNGDWNSNTAMVAPNFYGNLKGRANFLDMNALNGWTDCNLLFWNTPSHSVSCREVNGFSDAPNTGWWFIESRRHSNSSNIWGTQIAYGWEDNANKIYQRNVSNSSWSAWNRVDGVGTSIGVGQTWQSPSRSLNTTYWNTTGKPILVAVSLGVNAGDSASCLYIDGVIRSYFWDGVAGYHTNTVMAIVPAGSSYQLTASGFTHWSELR